MSGGVTTPDLPGLLNEGPSRDPGRIVFLLHIAHRIRRSVATLVLVGVASLALVLAAAAPALAAYMITPAPYRPKDFTLVKKDGLYHLFYIRNNQQLPLSQTENDFGHATSADFYHWTQLAPVLPTRPDKWDNAHVWAPSIVESNGVYYMFYTGVTSGGGFNNAQRTGVATSVDLENWTRFDQPLFECSAVPWSFCNPLFGGTAFRDPFVMADPANPGHWLMYYTAMPAGDSLHTVVAVAQSSGDLLQWTDLKPLWITYNSMTFNPLTESAHAFEHNGLWYLFYTTSSGQPLTLATAANPTADPQDWTYRGRLRNMLGYDTSNWYASEYFRDGTHNYFGFVAGDRVDVREISWGSGWQFFLTQPALFHVKSLDVSERSARDGDTLSLEFSTVNWLSGAAYIEAVGFDAGGTEYAIPLDSLGLSSPLPMNADFVVVPFVARRWPPTSDTSSVTRMVIRMTDQTAQTIDFTVLPPLAGPPPPPPPPPPADPPVDPIDIIRGGGISFRPARAPGSGAPALLVELDRSSSARIDLFDLLGRRVRTLVNRELPKGASVLPWDGRDADGAHVQSGVYFARLVTPQVVRTTRLLLSP